MDAARSPEVNVDINDMYAFFFKIEDTGFPDRFRSKDTVIKYARLPELDFESYGSWSKHSYSLQPRLRRIITVEQPRTNTSRSLKTLEPLIQSKAITNKINKRKIATISEDDVYNLHPQFSRNSKKPSTISSNRSTATESKKDIKEIPQKTTSRRTTPTKYLKEPRLGSKINTKMVDKKDVQPNATFKNKRSDVETASLKNRSNVTEKETAKRIKSTSSNKTRTGKQFESPNKIKQELTVLRTKVSEDINSSLLPSAKKHIERVRKTSSPPSSKNSKALSLLETQNKSIPVIQVPLEEKYQNQNTISDVMVNNSMKPTLIVFTKPNGTIDSEIILHKDMNIGTDPLPTTVDQITDMEGYETEIMHNSIKSPDAGIDLTEKTFDRLEIPNVSLKKDKSERIKNKLELQSTSLPNLQIPPLNIIDNRNEKSFLDTHYCKSTSYVISRSTLTYRTQQKINVHVFGSNDNTYSNQSPSPLTYPMNVLSVFRKEISSKDISNNISLEETRESNTSKNFKNCINEIKSLDCSYVPNSKKLMKPSDIISTIRVNNDLLQNVVLCEQFQRELNFIDSFFESLQYLESSSLSEKSYKNTKIDELINNSALLDSEFTQKNSEYNNFLLELENGANSDDSETIASKNLFLLNILIRDEQRRAKNLLCVLKRREDALKDFTKSQILYLENKKKQENTDISALKKKQRGALLKLQHECGEMQRMRKALLALSEKRKVALMKTKKDLELKLKNNVDVERIILGKKKLKRNTAVDRTSLPVKCFDLSSSGCEESTTSRSSSEGASLSEGSPVGVPAALPDAPPATPPAASAEKSIQAGDSGLAPALLTHSTETAAENFVSVDGGYLNILFHNLSLPQIFSGGKQYEVNEEALKNLVASTNSLYCDNWNEVVDELIDRTKRQDEEKSSPPSTARSLVEEFEQYYRTLAKDDRSQDEDYEFGTPLETCDVTQNSICELEPIEDKQCNETITITDDSVGESDRALNVDESTDCQLLEHARPSGPLPVPAGAADVTEPTPAEVHPCLSSKPSINSFNEIRASSETNIELVSSVPLTEPAHAEAEELRRQQLAIEREIKELEQQQCRLLVVREIPDKPPPPYTPPAETRASKLTRLFQPDDVTRIRIREHVIDPSATNYDPSDAFEALVHDFSKETVERLKSEQSDKPWDACNLLPQKQPVSTDKLVETTCTHLAEVLQTATPSTVTVPGVSSRRSDHIDNILFAEWRHAEPEWTALHSDDAHVKNQLFETIFQRVLTETVDEYKRTVLSPL